MRTFRKYDLIGLPIHSEYIKASAKIDESRVALFTDTFLRVLILNHADERQFNGRRSSLGYAYRKAIA